MADAALRVCPDARKSLCRYPIKRAQPSAVILGTRPGESFADGGTHSFSAVR